MWNLISLATCIFNVIDFASLQGAFCNFVTQVLPTTRIKWSWNVWIDAVTYIPLLFTTLEIACGGFHNIFPMLGLKNKPNIYILLLFTTLRITWEYIPMLFTTLGITWEYIPLLFTTLGITWENIHMLFTTLGITWGYIPLLFTTLGIACGGFHNISQCWDSKISQTFFPCKTHLWDLGGKQFPKIIPNMEFYVPVFSQQWEKFPFNSQMGISKSFLCKTPKKYQSSSIAFKSHTVSWSQ